MNSRGIPSGKSASAVNRAVVLSSTSAATRSGLRRANSRLVAPPSDQASSTARRDPTVSITEPMSSIRSASDGVSRRRSRSDMPIPRLSKVITRVNADNLRRKRASSGSCHANSTWEIKPGTTTRSTGPVPKAWYAMFRSPLRAYRVVGTDSPMRASVTRGAVRGVIAARRRTLCPGARPTSS